MARRYVTPADVGAAPAGHSHVHNALTGLGADDHPHYALADGSRGNFAPNWAQVTDWGVVGDSATDNTALFQQAIDEFSAAGGGVLYVPESSGYYRITSPVYARDNVLLLGAGYRSWIKNDRKTSATATDVSVFKFGNYNASDLQHSFMAETYYPCSAANRGQSTITLTTAANAANFVAGDIILLRDDELVTAGAHSHPRRHEINEVVSVDTVAGVVTLRHPLATTFPTLHAARSRGDLTDAFGQPVRVVKRAGIANMRLEQEVLSDTGTILGWGIFAYGGAFECTYRDLWVTQGSAFLSVNGLSRSLVDNCRVRLTRGKLFDVAMFSHHSTMRNIRYDRINNNYDYTGWNDQCILVGESVHGLTYEDIHANLGTWADGNTATFFGNGARNNTFRNVYVNAPQAAHSAFHIKNGSWPPLNNVMENCTAAVGSTTPQGFLLSTPGEGNRLVNPRVEGTSGIGVLLESTSADQVVWGARLPNSRVVDQGSRNVIEGGKTKTTQARVSDNTFTANSATADTVIRSYSIPAGSPSDRATWRFTAWGDVPAASTNSSKVIQIRVAGVNRAVLNMLATETGAWRIEFDLLSRTPTSQAMFFTTQKGTTYSIGHATSATDTNAGALLVELTTRVSNAADAVNVRGWRVEPAGDEASTA